MYFHTVCLIKHSRNIIKILLDSLILSLLFFTASGLLLSHCDRSPSHDIVIFLVLDRPRCTMGADESFQWHPITVKVDSDCSQAFCRAGELNLTWKVHWMIMVVLRVAVQQVEVDIRHGPSHNCAVDHSATFTRGALEKIRFTSDLVVTIEEN